MKTHQSARLDFWLMFALLALLTLSCLQLPDPLPRWPLVLRVLDVGQGNALLLQTSQGDWLVDTGPDSIGIVQILRQYNVQSLKGVVITHWHRDHAGGLREILDSMPVDSIWVGMDLGGGWLRPSERTLHLLKKGQVRSLSEQSYWQVLRVGTQGELGNEASVVLRVGGNTGWLLATGDIGWGQEQELMQGGFPLQAQVLIVPHHGSAYSSGMNFLGTVSPREVAISVGKNSFGHPAQSTLARLVMLMGADSNHIGRTDRQGTLNYGWSPVSGWWPCTKEECSAAVEEP